MRHILLASAATLLAVATAQAEDNLSNVLQLGSDNAGVVLQNGESNSVGTLDVGATQDGDRNVLDFSQIGSGNSVGAVGFEQNSNRNSATIAQTGEGNAVNDVTQTGNALGSFGQFRNTLTITQAQSGSGGNTVETVVQTRNGSTTPPFFGTVDILPSNAATIDQDGAGNRIVRLEQLGRVLGATLSQSGEGNEIGTVAQDGTLDIASVSQMGTGNVVNAVTQLGEANGLFITISGDRNGHEAWPVSHPTLDDVFLGRGLATASQSGEFNLASLVVTGSDNQFHLEQTGTVNIANGVLAGDFNAAALTQDGDLNYGSFDVTGDRNHVFIGQTGGPNVGEILIVGNDNHQALLQDGSNVARLTVHGDGNVQQVVQDGSNTLNLTIWGSNNNTGAFSLAALQAANTHTPLPLLPGDIFQTGSNTIDYQLGSATQLASNNLFAFSQNGSGNLIRGLTLGDFNEVALIQDGADNVIEFVQQGNGNNIGGVVFGSGNRAEITQIGDGNLTWFSQNGSNNSIVVSQ